MQIQPQAVNSKHPKMSVDPDTGRSLKAVYPTAGGYLFWYDDNQLPMVRHVVNPLAKGVE